MRLSDIMSKGVETISAQETAAAAVNRMRQRRIRHLVVLDAGKIVGLVSERDIAGLGSFGQVRTLEEVMARPVVTAAPHTTLRQAANLMRGRTIGSLPVIENGRLAGIVTVTDLLDLIGRGVERPVERGRRWTLKHRGMGTRRRTGRAG
jgi:acetoin utilization protein AcuB